MRTIKRDKLGHFIKGHTETKGVRNPMWRGDKAGYTSTHDWLYLRLGQPSFCEGCGKEDKKKYEWANLSGECKRVKTDWIRLCTSCHRAFDGHTYKMWETRRSYA
jgi:hypothetical protein